MKFEDRNNNKVKFPKHDTQSVVTLLAGGHIVQCSNGIRWRLSEKPGYSSTDSFSGSIFIVVVDTI